MAGGNTWVAAFRGGGYRGIPANRQQGLAPSVKTPRPSSPIVTRMTKPLESPDRSQRPAKPLLSALDPTHGTDAGDHGEDHATECAGRLVAGRYRVESLLARGGMALIWLAEDEFLLRQVALKQINVNDRASEQSRRAARVLALREARTAAQVNHPGVVTVYDVVRDDDEPWIVMELLRGRSLAEALDAEGPLRVEQVIHIGLSLLDVLRAVHRADIVHRDVKPANVQLCDGARVMLTDFGIAIATGSDSRTQICMAGSPGYVSPERLRGGKAGPASDLFSLGATLFTAVEGTSPFTRDNIAATLTAVAEEPPAPFSRAGPLRPVIEGLLAKEPNRRLNADQAYTLLHEAVHLVNEGERYRAGSSPAAPVQPVEHGPASVGEANERAVDQQRVAADIDRERDRRWERSGRRPRRAVTN